MKNNENDVVSKFQCIYILYQISSFKIQGLPFQELIISRFWCAYLRFVDHQWSNMGSYPTIPGLPTTDKRHIKFGNFIA